MIRKTLIALSAAATIGLALSTTSAKADSFDFGFSSGGASFNIHAGNPGYYGAGYYGSELYDADYGCQKVWKKKWVWNAWHTYKVPVMVKKVVCY
ncbi:MAG: hypothetical protein KGO94_11070 [Alphaproteobacteria bacterium]|nr:hypothetical protein [Alphaproteobacteria bacterium]